MEQITKIFVVVGGGSGIGRQVVQRLASDASNFVVAVSRRAASLEELKSVGGVETVIADASQEDSVKTVYQMAAQLPGKLAGVINCAGSVILKPAHLATLDEFNATILANLTTSFLLTKYGVPLMKEHGGSFVFFSTAALAAGLPNHDLIGAAKAGVEGFTRMCAATYAARGIRFNSIAPGLVRTPLTHRIHGSPTSANASLSMHPLGRFGEPEEVASLAHWLLTEEASWMTGQVLNFDGGLGLKTKAP